MASRAARAAMHPLTILPTRPRWAGSSEAPPPPQVACFHGIRLPSALHVPGMFAEHQANPHSGRAARPHAMASAADTTHRSVA